MSSNEVGDVGAAAIANALQDSGSLNTLSLRENQIGDALKVNASLNYLE